MKLQKLLLALACVAVTSSNAVPAAQIVSQSRGLQSVVELIDYNPFAGDEIPDFSSSPGMGLYDDQTQAAFTANDNTATSTANQNTTVNTNTLTFSGTGQSTAVIDSNFDASDVSSNAMANCSGNTGATVEFRLAKSGKVRLALILDASRGQVNNLSSCHAHMRIQTTTGQIIWSRLAIDETVTFNGDVILAAGSYQLIVNAGHNVSQWQQGPLSSQSTSSFAIDAQIIEDAVDTGGGGTTNPGKGKGRK